MGIRRTLRQACHVISMLACRRRRQPGMGCRPGCWRTNVLKHLKGLVLVGGCLAVRGGAGLFGWHYFSGKFDEFNAGAQPIPADVADSGWTNEAASRHADA